MMTADLVTKESEIKEKIIYGDLDMFDYDPRPEALGSVKYLCTDLTDIRRYYIRLGFHLEEFERCGYYRDFGYDNLYAYYLRFGCMKDCIKRRKRKMNENEISIVYTLLKSEINGGLNKLKKSGENCHQNKTIK